MSFHAPPLFDRRGTGILLAMAGIWLFFIPIFMGLEGRTSVRQVKIWLGQGAGVAMFVAGIAVEVRAARIKRG